LVLTGAFKASTMVAFFATTGIVLGAAYMLWLYRRVVLGPLDKDDVKAMLDLSPREILTFTPLLVLVFWMGIYPTPFLDIISGSVENLVDNFNAALSATANVSTGGTN